MQDMTELCGSTIATGSYSFGSSQLRPPRGPVQLFGSPQPVPTAPQHSGWVRPEVDSQGSMLFRWSTSRFSPTSQYQDDVTVPKTQFTDLLVRGTGTSWEDLNDDEPPPHTPGVHQQPRAESPPHPGWSTPPRRESIFEDDAVSPHRPTSSRRLSTGQRQRRSKQPRTPQQLEIALPEPMIDYINMCQD
uniref:Uncharacterized protein n=1 Tax=Anthurium amnicola TaxID=1678845 RepID=A0A1D1YJI8_9ARAE